MALILDFSKPSSLYPCGPAVSWATALLWARRHAGSWGHTQGLGSGGEMDGTCRGWGCRGLDLGVPPAGDDPGSLCCAGPSVGAGGAGQRHRALDGGPTVGAGSHSPPSSLSSPTRLVTRPGTFVPHSLWLVATTAFSRLLSECLTSQVPPPVSRWTWGLRPTTDSTVEAV